MAQTICPVVPTVVSAMFGDAEGQTFQGLIDTGAEISFLPREIVETFGVGVRGPVHATGFGQRSVETGLAVLTLQVPPLDTRALEIGVTDQQWDKFDLIVGMDYLSHFEIAIRYGTFGPLRANSG